MKRFYPAVFLLIALLLLIPVSSSVGVNKPATAIGVRVPDLISPNGTTLIIPLTVQDTTGQEIIAYQYDLVYDPAVIVPNDAPCEVAGTLSSMMVATCNPGTPGLFRVAVFGTTPLSGAGVLMKLKFDVVGAGGSISPLNLAQFMFNEGTPMSAVENGRVQVVSLLKSPFDFDGDSKTDIGIFRPANGQWWIQRSSTLVTTVATFGVSTDKTVPADYTGDGKADIAFFRPSSGEWFVLRSEDSSFYSFPFGAGTDIPVPGDFDGDRKADPTVFRPLTATWFILQSSGPVRIEQFGANGDRPVVGDYDGDGRADKAIYRPDGGQWWINRSATDSTIVLNFGVSTDKTVQGDYTGDGKTDAAFFRPSSGEWFILRSQDFSFFSFPFGTGTDLPVPGDYDGDGTADAAVFRPSNVTWFINGSQAGQIIQSFGAAGDYPLPNSFVK